MNDDIIIRIGHRDEANQQPFPPFHRLFEYTDFFPRSVTVRRGDRVNFQTQPFSFDIVALAADENLARAAYPIIELNHDDPPTLGTGLPSLSFGDGAFPVTGGSTSGGGLIDRSRGKGPPAVGAVQFGQPPGVFRGGDTVEIIGPTVGWDIEQRPATIDQIIEIDAPVGTYAFFDMLHPATRGTLTVVADGDVSTQAELDAAAERQFETARTAALSVEEQLCEIDLCTGQFGERDVVVLVGASAAAGRVLINEFFPRNPLEVMPGDRVHFCWTNAYGVHAVGFAEHPGKLRSPFGFTAPDGTYEATDNIFNAPPPAKYLRPGPRAYRFSCDPGTAPDGTALTRRAGGIGSGLLVGSRYGLGPTARSWSVRINDGTEKGDHHFFDAVHPWMEGVLRVR
ncbi:hypothetical protein DFR70_1011000 [Nocardia tenerifensis]|uniref:Uncharacterized protein n=1 Tax=Nocardia tenerifensis TaxID=228006 RepID=A0A318KBS6_9NOCA|nr:hypothetical protein [Nocardia tenerifensis]PXX71566.1 hypothetical protein DFR70_1011000 [Nocardia tenerifensis]